MKEGVDRLRGVREEADNRVRVVDAALCALQDADVLHHIGKKTVELAIGAVEREVEEYVAAAGPEALSDVRNIAQDAAEDILIALGYDMPEMLKDFNDTLNERLGLPPLSA